jgi:DNA alkylation repair enzyme
MTAIHPARMKIQVAQLGEKIRQPEAFVRALHNLLDFYADRTYRPGQSGEPPPLLATYKTPTPVFRQITREIIALAVSDPPAALELIDALWKEPYIEFRLLAITLIGDISPVPPEPVLTRIQDWVASKPENRLLAAILKHSLVGLRRDCPKIYYQMLEEWLNADELYPRQAGLHAMVPLLEDPEFENLPVLTRLLTPMIRMPPRVLRTELVAVLRSLARHYPQEASYLLRQNLSDENPDTIWLARQVLKDFPGEVQDSLRAALRPFNPT